MTIKSRELMRAYQPAYRDKAGSKTLRRLVGWRVRILLAIVTPLVVLACLDFITSFRSLSISPVVAEQADLTGTLTLAGAFESLVALVAGCVALLLAAAFSAGRRLAWAVVGGACVAFGLVDLLMPQPGSLAYAAFLLSGSLFLGLVVWCVWSVLGALRLTVISALLMASNPATGALESRVAGDPSNYHYVAADQPYALSGSAWHWLWVASRLQEAGEVISMLLLIECFLSAGARISDAGESAAAPYDRTATNDPVAVTSAAETHQR